MRSTFLKTISLHLLKHYRYRLSYLQDCCHNMQTYFCLTIPVRFAHSRPHSRTCRLRENNSVIWGGNSPSRLDSAMYPGGGVTPPWLCLFGRLPAETKCRLPASCAARIPRHLSGVLPKSLETWNYPSGCLLPQKAMLAGISYLRTV